ncbi:MAG: hypothetical protein G01um101448_247 [Parcubacteria group bacterium Gr01-1014_48]|nr:MAG: hypothetical protein Greene041614_69 [Parcubacteria group bacterium Greene0416_14]TSC74249.1 MAG: hypothetical protein G01um101448_247 [Parcubacteria group bacterium Gr01-1014_48]TSD01510.1 MAG: hypothetical protein Greene101415_226 [Parcubacteria group bacterium Greene1014_15]TSD08332.1 MAG: hypothetical protein Greene07144_183 [Parcubacteria group bacterium Greene0714_4]
MIADVRVAERVIGKWWMTQQEEISFLKLFIAAMDNEDAQAIRDYTKWLELSQETAIKIAQASLQIHSAYEELSRINFVTHDSH